MAVAKSRKTRSRRNMRRSHDALTSPALAVDKTTGETHRRHHLTKEGYYRGKLLVAPKPKKVKEEDEQQEKE